MFTMGIRSIHMSKQRNEKNQNFMKDICYTDKPCRIGVVYVNKGKRGKKAYISIPGSLTRYSSQWATITLTSNTSAKSDTKTR
jgi:hypothetical protein